MAAPELYNLLISTTELRNVHRALRSVLYNGQPPAIIHHWSDSCTLTSLRCRRRRVGCVTMSEAKTLMGEAISESCATKWVVYDGQLLAIVHHQLLVSWKSSSPLWACHVTSTRKKISMGELTRGSGATKVVIFNGRRSAIVDRAPGTDLARCC